MTNGSRSWSEFKHSNLPHLTYIPCFKTVQHDMTGDLFKRLGGI